MFVIMVCSKLCEKFGFGDKSYINGSKNCMRCDLFLITESMNCACCGDELIICKDGMPVQLNGEHLQIASINKKSSNRVHRNNNFKTEVSKV